MKAEKIFEALCNMAPLSLALSYDNAGFLLGDMQTEVTKAVVCLDATLNVVEYAQKEGAQLIISHHPIIFEPLKSITAQENSRIYKCLASGISVISMHTNMDSAVGGVNDCLAEALGLSNISPIEDSEGFSFRKGTLSEKMSADGLARFVKSCLGGVVRYTDSGKLISTVAVCGGSGGDFYRLAEESGADALVTADVKHSYFIGAADRGFTLIDAGHFHTENTVVEPLAKRLSEKITSVEFLPFNLREIKTV